MFGFKKKRRLLFVRSQICSFTCRRWIIENNAGMLEYYNLHNIVEVLALKNIWKLLWWRVTRALKEAESLFCNTGLTLYQVTFYWLASLNGQRHSITRMSITFVYYWHSNEVYTKVLLPWRVPTCRVKWRLKSIS